MFPHFPNRNRLKLDFTKWSYNFDTYYNYYIDARKNKLANDDIPRLYVYKIVNSNFDIPSHLELPYNTRKIISKIRCSNHVLEIEKGRHTNTPRESRLCENGEVEDEGHFLLNCVIYQPLRELHFIQADNIHDLLNMEEQPKLGENLISSFQLRERLLNGRGRE